MYNTLYIIRSRNDRNVFFNLHRSTFVKIILVKVIFFINKFFVVFKMLINIIIKILLINVIINLMLLF